MNDTPFKCRRKKRVYCLWLWLLALVMVLLAVSWSRERNRMLAAAPLNAATIEEFVNEAMKPDFSPDGFMRRALLTQFGPPAFTDPFGNFVYLRSKFLGSDPPGGITPPPALEISVIIFNRDGSLCRSVSLDSNEGFSHLSYKPTDGDLPPALSAATLLLLAVLWLRWEWRNRKRARNAELRENLISGQQEAGK